MTGTTVTIDFPENHHLKGNPYPHTYTKVAAHFYGSICADESGKLHLYYDLGNDIGGENPLSDKSRQLCPALEYAAKFLQQEIDRINQSS